MIKRKSLQSTQTKAKVVEAAERDAAADDDVDDAFAVALLSRCKNVYL